MYCETFKNDRKRKENKTLHKIVEVLLNYKIYSMTVFVKTLSFHFI